MERFGSIVEGTVLVSDDLVGAVPFDGNEEYSGGVGRVEGSATEAAVEVVESVGDSESKKGIF